MILNNAWQRRLLLPLAITAIVGCSPAESPTQLQTSSSEQAIDAELQRLQQLAQRV